MTKIKIIDAATLFDRVTAAGLDAPPPLLPAAFDGDTYDPKQDCQRLTSQLARVKQCQSDEQWRTLAEIAAITGDPEASISARLRDLRKAKYGSYIVEDRARGPRCNGLFEYRVLQGKRSDGS